jgi:hypothetical protein
MPSGVSWERGMNEVSQRWYWSNGTSTYEMMHVFL